MWWKTSSIVPCPNSFLHGTVTLFLILLAWINLTCEPSWEKIWNPRVPRYLINSLVDIFLFFFSLLKHSVKFVHMIPFLRIGHFWLNRESIISWNSLAAAITLCMFLGSFCLYHNANGYEKFKIFVVISISSSKVSVFFSFISFSPLYPHHTILVT